MERDLERLRPGDMLRDLLLCRGDLDRRDLERERVLERDSDLRFLRALSRSSFSFNSFSKAANGSSMTLRIQKIAQLSLCRNSSWNTNQLTLVAELDD